MHVNLLFEKLSSFETPDQIAEFLESRGIKGDVQDGDSCVISNWFLTETDAIGCTTTEQMITVEDDKFGAYQMVPNEVVVEFITKFDDWQYPNLIHEDWYGDY